MEYTPAATPVRKPTPQMVLSPAGQNQKRAPSLSTIFYLLGNHHRRTLYEMLCHHEAQIEDIVMLTGIPYQTIRKQLAILENAGLILSYKDRKFRFFHATPNTLTMLRRWAEAMSHISNNLN